MIRIIIILFVILLLGLLLKNIFTSKRKHSKKKEILRYCEFCKSYVTSNQKCINPDNSHKEFE